MGDLQCPARIFLVAAQEAAGWGERLRSERIAAVYAGSPGAAARAAETTAAALQVTATVLGAPASSGAGTEPKREGLTDIADRHRGEAVLLVDGDGSWAAALRGFVPAEADGPGAGAGSVGRRAGGVLALEADADGWRRVALPA